MRLRQVVGIVSVEVVAVDVGAGVAVGVALHEADVDVVPVRVRLVGVLAEAERRAVLDQHLAALDGPLAGERIVDVLEEGGYRAGPPAAASVPSYIQGWLHNKIRTASKRRNMRRPGHRNNIKYHDHRFPGVTATELEIKINRLGGLLGGRFAELKVSQLEKHVFRIDPS